MEVNGYCQLSGLKRNGNKLFKKEKECIGQDLALFINIDWMEADD